ncbi:MAG: MerR family transcriptional regulator [Sorangiineae bacterium]|nr:MerR family transcriptional regulator [Polyangiaceae bacterium]MEB2320949.1 MerR family transcriptional regulator [Sorangiineae bacterium]
MTRPREPNGSRVAPRRKDRLLTTGDMARLSANTLRTVRFYEETGIISPVQRTDGGHRLFEEGELHKLKLISEMRAADFSLDEIKVLIELKDHASSGAAASDEIVHRLSSQIDSLTARISLLEQLRAELEATRTLLDRCKTCTTDAHFPNACSECKKMPDAEHVPNAMSVLWRMR